LALAHQRHQDRSRDHHPVVDTDQDKVVGKDAVQGLLITPDQRSEEVAVCRQNLLLPVLPARLLGHSRSWLVLLWDAFSVTGRHGPGLLKHEDGSADRHHGPVQPPLWARSRLDAVPAEGLSAV
jgi:hypothetical protein